MTTRYAFDTDDKKSTTFKNGKCIGQIIIVLLTITTIIFVALWVQEYTAHDLMKGQRAKMSIKDKPTSICQTPECVLVASTLIRNMNRDIDPCDNFYEFACGKWNKSEPMPDDKSSWSVYKSMQRDLLKNVRASLTVDPAVLPPVSNSQTAKQKIQKYFATCMDTDQIRSDTVGPLLVQHLGSIDSILRNWPFIGDPAVHDDLSHTKTAVRNARMYGNSVRIFNTNIASDPQNPRENMINFEAGSFTLNQNDLLDDAKWKVRDAYVEFGTNVALEFCRKSNSTVNAETKTAIRDLFIEVVEFEQALANKTLRPEDRRDETKLQNTQNITQFAEAFTKSYNFTAEYWVEYFTTAYPNAVGKISVDTIVNVPEPEYYHELESQFQQRVNTSKGKEFLANYVAWKVIESYINWLDTDFRRIYLNFQKEVAAVTADVPRWELCLQLINGQLPNAVGSVYVEKYFRSEAKDEVNDMIDFLMKSFKEIVKDSHWMEEEVRFKALQKADKITRLVAYEDYLVNNISKLNEEHQDFETSSTFFHNFVKGCRFTVTEEGKKLIKGNSPRDWVTGAATANAFYNSNYNKISFPAGILQAPLFGYKYPKYFNYAATGTIIGHEITHGFDDQGSQTDGDGVLVDWWITGSNQTKRNFKKRAQGIIDQYSNYEYLGFKLNGVNNQGENIADNGGLKESFRAYNAYVKEMLNGVAEPRLPGFETFTSEQMFYLSFAQPRCSDYRPRQMELKLEQPHSPGRYRVIGPLQNSEDFARAYRCSPNTYMNPLQKFAVW